MTHNWEQFYFITDGDESLVTQNVCISDCTKFWMNVTTQLKQATCLFNINNSMLKLKLPHY